MEKKIKYYHWESTSNQREAVIAHVTSFKVYLPIHPPPECIYYNGVNIKEEKLLRVASKQREKKIKQMKVLYNWKKWLQCTDRRVKTNPEILEIEPE